jgi:hypothetical protein
MNRVKTYEFDQFWKKYLQNIMVGYYLNQAFQNLQSGDLLLFSMNSIDLGWYVLKNINRSKQFNTPAIFLSNRLVRNSGFFICLW